MDAKVCHESGLHVLRQSEGYILGSDTLLAECVLAFRMVPGQRLNVSLYDFAPHANATETENHRAVLQHTNSDLAVVAQPPPPHCQPQVRLL